MIMEFLLPSWWEVQVAVVAASFVILCCWFFNLSEDEVVDYRPPVGGSGIVSSDVINEKVDDDPACRDSVSTVYYICARAHTLHNIFLSLFQNYV